MLLVELALRHGAFCISVRRDSGSYIKYNTYTSTQIHVRTSVTCIYSIYSSKASSNSSSSIKVEYGQRKPGFQGERENNLAFNKTL